MSEVNRWFVQCFMHEQLVSKALMYTASRASEGSHSITCHPHVYPRLTSVERHLFILH